ncbi:MAG TPA: alkaline phosphatase family protein [Candidatus Cybelea sp.]|nr:alkaline phosphatase family protein [Candidatus Cybelea sp.]
MANARLACAALAAALISASCAQGPTPMPGARPAARPAFGSPPSGSSPIQHVVLLIQENRSFDNLFATFPGADGATTGRKGIKTVRLRMARLGEPCDFGHSYKGFIRDYNHGKMNGFEREGGSAHCPGKAGKGPYQYVNPRHIVPYWDIAAEYVLGDHMFQTQGSGSFTAHQDLIRGGTTIDAAQTISMVDYPSHIPWGCDAPEGTKTSLLVLQTGGQLKNEYHQGPYPCTTKFGSAPYLTLRDLLDTGHVSWKYYSPPVDNGSGNYWNAFDMIAAVRYGPEWKTNVTNNEKLIFNDVLHGGLPAVSWLIPDAANSDHPGTGSDTGPSWVAAVVNAIGSSQYWKNTAIIVVWDDWGGFYDHEPPPLRDQWGGLGFRVPMLLISPYARETSASKPGYISHTQYEFGSIIKFIEENWGLGALGTTDQRANSISDCFDYSQQPRAFVPIGAPYSLKYFLHQRPSYKPVDTE